MKKKLKKYKYDGISLLLLTIIFVSLVLFLTNGNYLYGSVLDWNSQHAVIPDYFRTLFYSTKDLLPDFAANIGGGQNIYNFSYYGFLSPIMFISYLFPKVPMTTYISISTIIIVLISTYMLYFFLRSKKYSSSVSFTASLFFMLSSSMSLHSHRHIMFITYMPFLILALFGVDKKFNNNKSWLLILSVFLMIMTNYYYSIGGIACIFVYAFIRYLKKMNKVTIKSFFKTFFAILFPILVGILASAIITIPTLATILYNRADSNVIISLKDLLIPNINTDNILYDSYGLGLTAIVFLAIINCFTKKNKEGIWLGSILTLLFVFDLFNYVLNGTMYIDAKSLIPFLPLYCLVIAEFIKDVMEKNINLKVIIPVMLVISILVYFKGYKWDVYIIDLLVIVLSITLYYIFKKKYLLIVPLCLFVIIFSFAYNKSDGLTLKHTYNENEKNLTNYVNLITEQDDDLYRISSDVSRTEFPNAIFGNINYYQNTIYSSVSNQTFNKLYFDTLANNIPSRNRALTVSNINILSLMLMSNKYLINNYEKLIGYELVTQNNGLNVYKNENVLPYAFASSEVMSYDDFYNLSDHVKQEALLKNIIIDGESSNSFKETMKSVKWDFLDVLDNENVTKDKDGSLNVYVKDDLSITYELPEIYRNKILLIRFKMNKGSYNRDMSITINNVKNKLTASSWKYYNGNKVFDYVLASENQEKLVFKFTKGEYNLSDFEVSVLDYSDIENISSKVDKLIVDKEKTKGDVIAGSINVTNDGFFMASIPYDNGFKVKVDGVVKDYTKVNDGFIGFPISKGSHGIEITYEAPLKNIALKMSLVGIIAFVVICFLESKKKI